MAVNLTSFSSMPLGINPKQLQLADNPLFGFEGNATLPLGKIVLPLSFGTGTNAQTKHITFDVIDIDYPYNTILGRGAINAFEAGIHGLYLCMKILGLGRVITIFGDQQVTRNIERDFVPRQ